jgi:hypothetical protein
MRQTVTIVEEPSGAELACGGASRPGSPREIGARLYISLNTVKTHTRELWADSSGVRKELGELLGWCHESERLAGAVVEAGGDAGEILSRVHGQVGAFG